MVKSSPSSRVELLGLLPREQMLRIFLRCAVSLVLYDDQRNHSHIRSNRFFESLAAGVPVIVSDFPEWRKVVESIGCGLCVRPTDPQAIADALRILLTHPAEAEAMGKRGRCAFLKTFSWAPERNKLLALYNTLFAENPPTREIAATSQVA
jgi:glycosyltransferase involved in cell wall biosynthesis